MITIESKSYDMQEVYTLALVEAKKQSSILKRLTSDIKLELVSSGSRNDGDLGEVFIYTFKIKE